jgi:hypothetical protein
MRLLNGAPFVPPFVFPHEIVLSLTLISLPILEPIDTQSMRKRPFEDQAKNKYTRMETCFEKQMRHRTDGDLDESEKGPF